MLPFHCYIDRDGTIAVVQHRTIPCPKELLMTDPIQLNTGMWTQPIRPFDESDLRRLVPSEFLTFISPKVREKPKTPDELFQELDVQSGDRIRLTELAKSSPRVTLPVATDAAVLEGNVLAIKTKDGHSKVQLSGFAVSGNNIFWPVRLYKVEVLKKAYRWNDEDRAIVAIIGNDAAWWERLTETAREQHRGTYRPRLTKVRAALGLDGGVE